MPGDYSRKIFNKKKHYRGVLMQQGRVQLDSDWNEQLDISQYQTVTEAIDVIGTTGVPKKDNGFKINITTDGTDIQIAPGRIYVEGQLCELDDNALGATTYFNQPYYPNPDKSIFLNSPLGSPLSSPASPVGGVSSLNLADGAYIVYLDAWQREINYLDDARIHEVALGEADTTTRQQSIWQVKYLKVTVPEAVEVDCKTQFNEWNALITPFTGKLNVQTNRSSSDANPCLLPPGSGYRRLENQLYRVEVQSVDEIGNVTFKWSRDNASVETTVANPLSDISSSSIVVNSIGKDSVLGFAIGQWIEVVDDQSELSGKPNPLIKISDLVPSTRRLTFTTSVNNYSKSNKVKLRRWDQTGSSASATGVAATNDWVDLEYGVQVKFSGGTYQPGSYWLIPGRTATGEVEWPPYEIPNLNPIEQLPVGNWHKYAKLALLKINGNAAVLADCRNLFPSLNDISADDVSFSNANCNLGDADNVQEALDLLCAANDLRLHHKLMHGYGVVCGLKVSCGFNRQQVNISSGYAIDCEGNIIQAKNNIAYSLVEQAAAANLLDAAGNGTVCLSISAKGAKVPLIALEAYVKKSFWEEVLEDSLLKDFFDDYILNLIAFAKKQLSFSLTEQVPIPIEQRRLSAMINLFAQLINSASGSYGFISGQKGKRDVTKSCGTGSDEKIYEDQLLWCFYNELRNLLSSSTFCAMRDQDKQFPDYPLDEGLDTIFGTPLKFHSKLKLDPSGKFAYTCGMGNHITVYDLQTNEAVEILTFPSTTNVQVLDIAIAADGKSLYAIGVIDDKDSYFAVASIDANGKHTWSSTSPKCGKKFVTLAIKPNSSQLYAISFNEGLYELSSIGTANFACTPVREGFHPTGLLAFSEDGMFAFAAAGAGGVTAFNKVNIFNISVPGVVVNDTFFSFAGENANNDILYFNKRIYITGTNAGGGDVLGGFDQSTGILLNPLLLESSSVFRMALLAINNSFELLITLADKFKVIRISLGNPATGGGFQLIPGFRIPVQLFPMGIVVNNFNKKGYVLNTMVNTLTVFNIDTTFATQPPDYTTDPPLELAYYRDDVLAAFKDIFKHLLEYLKDGFCEEFLIDCPQCTEANKVYLGSVEIRDRQVYHICNFSKRKYVKSFPSVEYWMSTLPILPIMKEAFIKFCCAVV
jgi:DNA-binding beta-propeller fold protein YncE